MPHDTSTPRITVVTPSFNQARFLDAALTSIHAQNYPNLEHIVLDAGSTDGSVEIIERFAARLSYWHSRPDGGQSDAINFGFRRATGDILLWINSDDMLAPGSLLAMARAFSNPKAPAWGIGGCICVDADGRETRSWAPGRVTLDRTLDWGTAYIFQPAVFWTRALWEEAGPLDEALHYAMDFDLWLAFFARGAPVIVDSMIGVHRTHADTKTSGVGERLLDEYLVGIERRLTGARRRKAIHHVARQAVERANGAFFHRRREESRRYLRYAVRTSRRIVFDRRFIAVCVKHLVGRTAVEAWWKIRA